MLFGAAKRAHSALDKSGKFVEPANRLSWERDAAYARRYLSDNAWEEAWSARLAMTLERAIVYASEDNG
jgi:hypothetical protein